MLHDFLKSFIGNPIFAKRYAILVVNTSSPYLHERIKFIDEASGKYFVGQEISPILNPLNKMSDNIWLSNIKSSLQS